MTDSDEVSDSNVIKQGDVTSTIPQIILTEPAATTQEEEQHAESTHNSPIVALSPKAIATATSSSPATTPLPLTKDLLQRKNKLDRLLLFKEKNHHQQQQQQPQQAEFYSSALDERVTAGLGISTPNASKGVLRSRRPSHYNNPNRNEPEKTSAFSHWSYDLDVYNKSSLSSQHSNKLNATNTSNSHDGDDDRSSNNRNSVSMRPYSAAAAKMNPTTTAAANHRYMDNTYTSNRHYQRPLSSQQQQKQDEYGEEMKNNHKLIDLLYQAVVRVVNSRAPESKKVRRKELFDFATEKEEEVAITTTTEAADSAAAIDHVYSKNSHSQYVNESHQSILSRIMDEKEKEQPTPIAAVIGSPTSPKTNSNRNSTITNNNRFSWLSHTSSFSADAASSAKSITASAAIEDEKKSLQQYNSREERPLYNSNTFSSSTQFTKLMPNPLQGHSLYIFGPNHPLRIFVWKFIRNRHVETIIFFLMILHWFLLACVPITTNKQKSTFGGQWNHYPILFIQSIYTIETICKIIAYGLFIPPKSPNYSYTASPSSLISYYIASFFNSFKTFLHHFNFIKQNQQLYINDSTEEPPLTTIATDDPTLSKSSTFVEKPEDFVRNHRAYLNSFGNAIDIISVGSYWADLALMVFGYPNLSLFKSLSAFRPLRLLSILPGTAVILKSLETSWDILLAVSLLILFFLLLFALLGLISFQGVFSRRCYFTDTNHQLTLVEPALFCSGFVNGTKITGAINVQTGTTSYPGYHGYICAQGQICMEDPVNNPEFGFVNFDNIFFSFLSVYTFVSLELWTDLMYQTQDSDSTVAALYYCLGVYIIAFVLTFLLFAVITSAFARVRAVSAVSAFTAKKKGYPVLRDAVPGAVAGDEDDEGAMWMYDNSPEDLGRGMSRLKLRWWIVRLVKSTAFFYFGGFLVLLDMIFMCLRSFYASEQLLELIDNAETAFTFVFAIEIIIRMAGATSWMNFWSTKRNLFDLFLVISTCVIQLPMIQDSYVYKYLTIFQILRMYRLFICIPRVRRLLSAALGTGESVIYVMVFLVLATALCATIFMQMFGGDFDSVIEITEPGNRFDTFYESFVSLIVVYTSETWTGILYNAMASQTGQGSIYAAIALSIYFAFGRYIMSGLYIAVVLENFELSDDYIRHYQIKDFIHRHRFKDIDKTETILLKLFRPFYYFNENKNIQVSKLPANLTAPLTKSDLNELLTDLPKSKQNIDQDYVAPTWIERNTVMLINKVRQKIPFLKKTTSIKSAPIYPFIHDLDEAPEDYDMIAAEENREALKENTPIVNSLFLFSNRSRIRYWCKKLVGTTRDGQAEKTSIFNWIVMALVLVSIIMVILDEPSTRLIRKDTAKQDTFNQIEISLSILFVVELMIRIIADGLLLTPNAYLRNHWNQLDFCVIVLNIITTFMGTDEAPRGLSTFRSLRILRLIRYFSGVRDIFVSLFYALPLMLDALIFTFLVLIPFAIYGVNIFGGLMWLCNDETVLTRGECIGEFWSDISDDDISVRMWVPRVWQNPQNGVYSYDNFQVALQHLFSITSTEGWVDSMFSAMSTPRDPDNQPQFDWNSQTVFHGLFYIVFMIISQGTIQLFVGVIIEKFKERNGITTLTTAQRQYGDLQRLLANVKPTIKVFRPTSKIRRICHDMVIEKHGKLNRIMMCIIGLNIIMIASEFKNEPTWLTSMQDYAYLAFTIIYVIECIIKLLGLGWKKWIRSKWNWFDFLIAFSALFLLILRFAIPDLWTVRVERYCLVLAAFRLGEGIDSLQTLYHTIAKSLPSIIQVSTVFMVAMCLFAMIFMEFFGLTKYGIYGSAHTNFRDYGNALLLLVRATTGEAWNAIIVDYAVQYPNCNSSSNYLQDDCGSVFWAYFLFDVFYIVCTHIFMNLFTAVIISNFEYAYETRTRFTNITKADLRMFKHAWADIDTDGTGYIQKEDVAKLLRKLTGRFQFRIYDEAHSLPHIMRCSRKPIISEKNQSSPSINASPNSHGGNSPHDNSPNIKSSNGKSPNGKSPNGNSGYSSYAGNDGEINVKEINRCLSKMDVEEVRHRRLEYNLYFKEILRTETPRGIPFAAVLTIISYRFINISTALTLDPLIARLEKMEQLTQEYNLEKAAGFFLSQVQKKRFIHALWQKRDEDEVKKLGVTNTSHFEFGSSPNSPNMESPINYLSMPDITSKDRKKRSSPPVPRIVIDNVSTIMTTQSSPTTPGTTSIPVSPMSHFSMDNQYDASFSGGAYSLSVAPGTSSIPSSPNTDFEHSGRLGGSLSPYSPIPNLSPNSSRQNWLLIDGNVEMPTEISDNLMDSMHHSIWSDMLRDENNL